MRKRLIRIIILLSAIALAFYIFIFKPYLIQAAWYDLGWGYRKQLIVTGSTNGAQTNYQMKLIVYKSAGADSPGTVYLGTNVKNDFSDLRFTKSDGTSLLNYWIESKTDGNTAAVWIEFDSIPASPSTTSLYIYYGNSGAAVGSNGSATFPSGTYATGGTVTTIGGERINTFLTSDTLNVTFANANVKALVVAGGGNTGGGVYNQAYDAGGGGGQVVYNANYSIGVGSYATTVGGANQNSVFNTITANAGGNGYTTGHGGASGSGNAGGSQTVRYASAGGGGDSAVGGNGGGSSIGLGGAGTANSISGSSVTYGKGGDGNYGGANVPGDANTGNGGAGNSSSGGSGIAIVRYTFRNYTANEPTWGTLGSEEPAPTSTPTPTPTITPTPTPAVPWYDPAWGYRKQLTVTGSIDGVQTNYQMKLTVNYGSGTDSNGTVYLGGKSQTNFNDLRFTNSNGTLLDYWIESKTDGSTATVWIEFDSIPASPSTVNFYIYYGNSGASAVSNGTNTFQFFDDFEGSSINSSLWDSVGGGILVSNSVVTFTTSAVNTNNSIISKIAVSVDGTTAIRARLKSQYINSTSYGEQGFGLEGHIDTMFNHRIGGWQGNYHTYITSSHTIVSFAGISANTWFIQDLLRVGKAQWYADGGNLKEISANYPSTTYKISTQVDYNTAPASMYVDWVLVRKYTVTEPTWGTLGSEEKLPIFNFENVNLQGVNIN